MSEQNFDDGPAVNAWVQLKDTEHFAKIRWQAAMPGARQQVIDGALWAMFLEGWKAKSRQVSQLEAELDVLRKGLAAKAAAPAEKNDTKKGKKNAQVAADVSPPE